MKARDLISKSVSELTAKLKEIKQGDEDDLGKVAKAFDEVAHQADKTATTLERADAALGGEGETEEGEGEGEESEDAKPES